MFIFNNIRNKYKADLEIRNYTCNKKDLDTNTETNTGQGGFKTCTVFGPDKIPSVPEK
jgi:hypothetical protein